MSGGNASGGMISASGAEKAECESEKRMAEAGEKERKAAGLKVLVYKDNLATGRGADHLICAQAAALREMGHEVCLATCSKEGETAFAVDPGLKMRCGVKREEMREIASGYDVCVAAGSNEIMDLTAGGKADPPCPVVTEMLVAPEGFFKWRHPLRNRAIKKAFDRSTALQILCSAYEKDVRKFAKRPEIAVIAEWPDVREPEEAELRGERRKKVVTYPAAVNRRKNQLLLIRAFALLADDFPDWELHIYGTMNSKYGAKCVKAAEKTGLGERIKFLPFTSDLAKVYAEASVMAFPSLLEGFPLTILEAAKFALPAVVTEALPAAREIVSDGESGIVAGNSPREYAAALGRMMGDEKLRREFGEAARRRCSGEYTKEAIMGAWDGLLRKTAKERSRQDGR